MLGNILDYHPSRNSIKNDSLFFLGGRGRLFVGG